MSDWKRGRTQASIAFVNSAQRALEETSRLDHKHSLERAVAEVKGGAELHQSLTAEAYLYVEQLPRGSKTHTQKTGPAFIGSGPAIDITVYLNDAANGAACPVRLEWPLVVLRFPTLLDVRLEFMTFRRFDAVQQGLRDLIVQCLDELEVPYIRPY